MRTYLCVGQALCLPHLRGAPDCERPSAGVVPPCHTPRRPHTPQLQEMVGVCDYKTRALFAFCQWTVHWSIMGRTTNRASENKRPHIVWESQVLKLTCPLYRLTAPFVKSCLIPLGILLDGSLQSPPQRWNGSCSGGPQTKGERN